MIKMSSAKRKAKMFEQEEGPIVIGAQWALFDTAKTTVASVSTSRFNDCDTSMLVKPAKKLARRVSSKRHLRQRKFALISKMILNLKVAQSGLIALLLLLSTSYSLPTTSGHQQLADVQQSEHSFNNNPQQNTNAQTNKKQQQEILVLPNSPVRIECKLPQVVANGSRRFYWNFQRSALHEQKPDLLCFQQDCIDQSSYGIQLDIDPASGAYDLVISNATYELNDGIYYCDYRDKSPESRATINREVRLTVLIPPQPPVLSAPSAGLNSQEQIGGAVVAREGQKFSLHCKSFGGNPEPSITWYRNDKPILATGSTGYPQIEQTRHVSNSSNAAVGHTTSSLLTWIPTLDDHLASYKCSVSNKAMQQQPAYERELTLAVEYAPRISVGPANPLRLMQGERATLSCQVDANPPVKGIRWLRDGHSLSNQFNYTINELKISDSGLYSCQADNGIAPTLAQLASSGAQSATGSNSNSLLSFFGLSSSQASGGDKTSVESRLQLEVLYAPRVQVRESRSMPLNEGDYFSLNCTADSWPPAHEFIWMKHEIQADGQTIVRRLSSSTGPNSSPSLEFQSISASDIGNYSCIAINRLEPTPVNGLAQLVEHQGSASFVVQVRHKPGLAELSAGLDGETELGNRTQLICRAKPPGYPEPQYKFWKYQANSMGQMSKLYLKQTHGSSYQIYSAKPEDEAKYGCVASNELGQSNEASAELVVNEAPNVIVEQVRHNEDSRSPGDGPYSITVRASGKPEPRVAWFHRSPLDGRRVELSSAEMSSRFKIDTVSNKLPTSGSSNSRPKYSVVTTLNFKRALDVEDRGLYTVEFSNGLSRMAINEFQLHISHAPIPAPKGQSIVGGTSTTMTGGSTGKNNNALAPITRTRAGYNIGETVNLTCRVSAHPQPQFVWYGGTMSATSGTGNEDKPIDGNPRYRTSVQNTIDDIWEGTLSFELSSESDYGDYMCVTANHDPQTQAISDSIQILISLGHKSAPEAPQQIEQIDATQDSITLQWLAGFDGGLAPNQFLVLYAPESEGAVMSLRNSLEPVNEQQQQQQQQEYPKQFECFASNPCTITQLAPKQTYVMRVRARNELGSSPLSDEVRASTRSNDSQSLPRIQNALFDSSRHLLHLQLEPSQPEYLLNNLNVRIEARYSPVSNSNNNNELVGQAEHESIEQIQWKHYSTMPIRLEHGTAQLSLASQIDNQIVEQFRLTLCSRTNEGLCGPEYVFSMRGATSSSLAEQVRGLSWPFMIVCLSCLIVLAFVASTLNSCCLSRARKAKKVAAAVADAVDHHHHHHQQRQRQTHAGQTNGTADNKYTSAADAPASMANGSHKGSTTSTNSTNVAATNQLNSMDSLANGQLVNGFTGTGSDHSSDQSRQAKLDSMLPPNYNHYADRASLMLEQQQQQQQQAMFQQPQSMVDKLSSPFGLPSSALFGQPIIDPFSHYGTTGPQTIEPGQYDQQPIDAQSLVLNSMIASGPLDPTGSGAQQHDPNNMWAVGQQHHIDDYNSYNSYAGQTQQQQMIESAYGTAAQIAYDNSANQQQAFQQQSDQMSNSYHQEIQAAQQQMYGTLTRQTSNQFNGAQNSYNHQDGSQASAQSSSNEERQMQQQPQQIQQQQAHDAAYMSTNGLMLPPLPPQESDYGTTGSRTNGRLIREIIV